MGGYYQWQAFVGHCQATRPKWKSKSSQYHPIVDVSLSCSEMWSWISQEYLPQKWSGIWIFWDLSREIDQANWTRKFGTIWRWSESLRWGASTSRRSSSGTWRFTPYSSTNCSRSDWSSSSCHNVWSRCFGTSLRFYLWWTSCRWRCCDCTYLWGFTQRSWDLSRQEVERSRSLCQRDLQPAHKNIRCFHRSIYSSSNISTRVSWWSVWRRTRSYHSKW